MGNGPAGENRDAAISPAKKPDWNPAFAPGVNPSFCSRTQPEAPQLTATLVTLAPLIVPEPGRDRIRLVAAADGSFYYGDVSTEFMRPTGSDD